MSEVLQQGPERQPVQPQWSIQPQEHEHSPDGRPPFDILFLPETPRVIELKNVFFNQEGKERLTDYPVLETSIQERIANRRQEVEEFNAELRQQLLAQGRTEEEITPHLQEFFDGNVARLHPEDLTATEESIGIRLGETTYHTYAGSRLRNMLPYGYHRLGLALGVCATATAPSEDGTTKILYTIRGTINETYPGWYHTVGGTVKTAEKGITDPNGAIKRELTDETGLKEDEFTVAGVSGIVMNITNGDVHPELIYNTTVQAPIEQWLGKRPTDREVEIAAFTNTPENLAAFILGQPFAEVPDARPIVPGGLAGYLFYGRVKYGEEWYNDVHKKLPQY